MAKALMRHVQVMLMTQQLCWGSYQSKGEILFHFWSFSFPEQSISAAVRALNQVIQISSKVSLNSMKLKGQQVPSRSVKNKDLLYTSSRRYWENSPDKTPENPNHLEKLLAILPSKNICNQTV